MGYRTSGQADVAGLIAELATKVPTARTLTPSIAEIEVNYDYTLAEEHFRGGVVVDDGVAYVGAFRQPGDRVALRFDDATGEGQFDLGRRGGGLGGSGRHRKRVH